MKIIPVFLSALLLAACTTPGARLSLDERQAAWEQNSSRLDRIHSWSMRGRVAVHANGHGWQAGIRWSKMQDTQEIRLNGPFGGGVVLLKQDPSGIVLRDSRGEEYMDTDMERVLAQVTGWHLPVDGLVYWVRGQLIPGVPSKIKLDNHGRLQKVSQQRWQITYERYGEYHNLPLPRRMIMKLPAEDNDGVGLEVRLALNHWNLGL